MADRRHGAAPRARPSAPWWVDFSKVAQWLAAATYVAQRRAASRPVGPYCAAATDTIGAGRQRRRSL